MSLFAAYHGAVYFDGKPIPELRAIAVRQHLVARALDRSVPEPVANALWSIRDQLVAALEASRAQKQIIKTACSASASPVANRRDPEMRLGHGRESQA